MVAEYMDWGDLSKLAEWNFPFYFLSVILTARFVNRETIVSSLDRYVCTYLSEGETSASFSFERCSRLALLLNRGIAS